MKIEAPFFVPIISDDCEFFDEIKKNNIPIILLNGRITKKSFKRWMKFPDFAKKNFKQHFTHNSLVVSIKGATNLSCNICATTFMKIKFNIMYDPFGRIFYPKILQYFVQ